MLDGCVAVQNYDTRIAVLVLIGVDVVERQHLGRDKARYVEQDGSDTLHCFFLRKQKLECGLFEESEHRLLLALRGYHVLPLGEVAKTVSTGLTPRNSRGNEVFLRYVEVDDVLGCHISFDFLRESLDASRPETACVDFDFVVCTVIAGFHVVVDHIYEVASSLLVFGVSGRNGLQVFVLTDFQLRLFL